MAHGGKREGAGRPKGALNKVTADVRVLAQEHTADALATLAAIMNAAGESAAARVAAANSLLDRAHGKPTQPLGGDADNPLKIISEIRRSIVDPGNPNP